MGVQHGPFEQEYVAENTVFKSKIYFRNLPLSLLSLIELVVKLVNLGIARLGRSKSRGYGQITIDAGNIRVLFIGRFDEKARVAYSINLSKEEGKFEPIEVEVIRQEENVIVKDSYAPEGMKGDIIEKLPFGLLCVFTWDSVKKNLANVLNALKTK